MTKQSIFHYDSTVCGCISHMLGSFLNAWCIILCHLVVYGLTDFILYDENTVTKVFLRCLRIKGHTDNMPVVFGLSKELFPLNFCQDHKNRRAFYLLYKTILQNIREAVAKAAQAPASLKSSTCGHWVAVWR